MLNELTAKSFTVLSEKLVIGFVVAFLKSEDEFDFELLAAIIGSDLTTIVEFSFESTTGFNAFACSFVKSPGLTSDLIALTDKVLPGIAIRLRNSTISEFNSFTSLVFF